MSQNALPTIAMMGKGKRYTACIVHEKAEAEEVEEEQKVVDEEEEEATVHVAVTENAAMASMVQVSPIPLLPEEMAMECMARVPRLHYRRSIMKAVSRQWRNLLSDLTSQLYKHRRQLGIQEPSILQLYARDPDMAMTRRSSSSPSPAISVSVMQFFPSSSSSLWSKNDVDQEEEKKLRRNQYHGNVYYPEPLWAGMASLNIAVIVVPVKYPFSFSRTSWMEDIYAVDIFEKRMYGLPAMSLIRDNVAYAILDGMLYAVGGIIAPAPAASSSMFASRAVERYDFRSRCWIRVADMPLDMTVNQCAAVSGRLLLIGNIFDKPRDLNKLYRTHLTMQPVVIVSYSPCSDSWQIHNRSCCLDIAFTCVCCSAVVHSIRPRLMTVAVHGTLAGPFDGRGNRVLRLVHFHADESDYSASSSSSNILELQISDVSFNDQTLFSTWQPVCRFLFCHTLRLDYRANNVLHVHSLSSTSRGDSCVVTLVSCDPDVKLMMLEHQKPDFTVYFQTLLSKPEGIEVLDPKLCPLVVYL